MSFVIILLAGVTFYIENNSEDSVEIVISEIWVMVGNKFYDFSKILSFCFLYDGAQARILRLKINKNTLSNLDVDVDNQRVVDIKSILSQYIKEDEKWEFTFSDKLIHYLKL